MIVQRSIGLGKLWRWSASRLAWLVLGATSIALLYKFQVIDFYVPWLPVSLIGTAVAFYVGFKNNSAYDRMWEARKIWGGIVNTSRSFAASARAFITDEFASAPVSHEALKEEIRVILYRHIGWLYALKHAMWQRTKWEHQLPSSRRQRDYFRKRMTIHSMEESLARYLSKDEQKWISGKQNKATQLLDRQSQHLAELKRRGLLDGFCGSRAIPCQSDPRFRAGVDCERATATAGTAAGV